MLSILLFPCAVLCTADADSTINIDINISDNKEQEHRIERNTTSTVFMKEREATAAPSSVECVNRTVSLATELTFGTLLDNMIRPQGNLTWSGHNLENIDCVTEFVVMYRDADNETASSTVLCPGYQILTSGQAHSCGYNLTQARCGARLLVMIEAWTLNRMIQPSTVVTVNCDESAHEEAAVGSRPQGYTNTNTDWQLPLVLASLQAFSSAATQNSSASAEQLARSCSWTDWSGWGSCSITCGGRGRRTRQRSHTGSRICTGREEESKDCHVNLCPVDCVLSLWAEWSSCSTSCGNGMKTRKREITQKAQNWGNECPRNTEEQEPCIEEDCAVDGAWSSWSRWGYCSQTCGHGSRSRSRTCTMPTPQNGGNECLGANLETKECKMKVCPPVDGRWSSWGRWSSCSKTCGKGEQRRVRTCTDPPASSGGRECTGERFQNNICFLRRCAGEETTTEEMVTVEKDHGLNVTKNLEIPTTSRPVEDAKLEPVTCGAPPHVLGFLDPEVLLRNKTKMTNFTQDIQPGYTVKYTCSKGQVLDTRTNRRTFHMKCSEAGEYVIPATWPTCRAATHCVGPVARPGQGDDVYLPVPRRDSPVNTNVKYKCKQNTARIIYASCFYDGRYRYDADWPSCDQSPTPDLCKESGATENSNVMIAIPGLTTSSHGWLTSPDYPELSSTAASCSWAVKAPYGFTLALGVETLRGAGLNTTQHTLEIAEKNSVLPPRHVTLSHIGNTFLTLENSIVIRSVQGVDLAWRLSYLVVEPT
jgi:hypothetical protein